MYKKLETLENSLKDGTRYVINPNTEITNVIAERMAGVVPIETRVSKEKDKDRKT